MVVLVVVLVVVIDHRPGREVVGQQAPLAAGAHHVEDGIDHLSRVYPPGRPGLPFGCCTRDAINTHWASVRSVG